VPFLPVKLRRTPALRWDFMKIAAGTARQLLRDPQVRAAYLGLQQ